MLDVIAWAILAFLWIFGGAAFLDNNGHDYKSSLLAWIMLNAILIVAVFVLFAALWAVNRVTV